jgi:hypothetical protein
MLAALFLRTDPLAPVVVEKWKLVFFCVLDWSTLIYYKLQSGWRELDHGKLS